jgi:DNA-binding NtrC family response regulator
MGSLTSSTVLLVEDKDSLRTMLRLALEREGHTVIEAIDEPSARAALAGKLPGVVLSDLKLPDGDGFGVLRAAKELDPALPVIVMTAYGRIEDAVAAIREGALDFLPKPVDPNHLALIVARALEQRRLMTENMILRDELAQRRGAPQIVGQAESLRRVQIALHRAAETDTTVLLEGESGTGKELFARTLHALGTRSDMPFVAINCAAIPENLLESELFGYEKGAFTGAVGRKLGKFELANTGTLFLDEIGELPLGLQAKLLRALEERRFERLGGTATVHIDVRLIAATNRGLKAAIAARKFREDLYFRLSVFPITIPPLRERREDIPMLARFFVEGVSRDLKKPTPSISAAALAALEKYHWPGNVRELQNCLERAVILSDEDALQPRHLNLTFRSDAEAEAAVADPWDRIDLEGPMSDVTRRVVAEVERRKLEAALRDCAGHRIKAAEVLGLTLKAMSLKMREHRLD